MKGIFGESEACLARFKLHAGRIVAPLVILVKFQSCLLRLCLKSCLSSEGRSVSENSLYSAVINLSGSLGSAV